MSFTNMKDNVYKKKHNPTNISARCTFTDIFSLILFLVVLRLYLLSKCTVCSDRITRTGWRGLKSNS